MRAISVLAIVIGVTFLCYSPAVCAEPAPGKQVEQTFKSADSTEVRYLLYLPENYKPDATLPVMLFLHGRGESDGPLSVVAKWGPPLLVERGENLPYILISPQCPKEDNWSSATQQSRLIELLATEEKVVLSEQVRIRRLNGYKRVLSSII